MKFPFTSEVKETIAESIAHEYFMNHKTAPTTEIVKSTVRLMMKAANIETNDENVDATSERVEDLLGVAHKKIERLSSAEPKWIPVTERLPMEFLDRRILVSTVSPTGRRSVDIGLWLGGKWTTYFPIGDDKVTAWMPLPDCYEKADE